jgi:peptidoglycan/xylan/chitin deacetylase (PgdA/CDA1 family)
MAQLPVLMYHNVSPDIHNSKGLTISVQNLENQFKYLAENGYASLHLHELEKLQNSAKKNVVITFDDVTVNQMEYALPLLEKYNLKAVFFIPFNYVGKSDLWNKGSEPIMSIEQLKSLNSDLIEFGYHSFMHHRYAAMTDEEINNDFAECRKFIKENTLKVYPAVAYPYGNYPKKEPAKSHFKQLLESNDIKMGFKIGNRLNKLPLRENYEIQRIDVKGEDSMLKFKLKLKLGKLKLF